MIVLTTVIILLLTTYVVGTLAFLFLSKVENPYSENENFNEIKSHPLEELPSLEEKIRNNPTDFGLRLELLKSVMTQKSGYGLEHAIWMIENEPLQAHNVLCASPFLMDESKHPLAVELWRTKIVESGRSDAILKKAAIFCTNLDKNFALECANEFWERHPLSPEGLYEIAEIQQYLSNPDNYPSDEWKVAWNSYRKYLGWTWSEDDYWRLEILKKKIGSWLWPKPFAFALLWLKGRLTHQTNGPHWLFYLSDMGNVAIFAGDLGQAQKIGREVLRDLPRFEKECKWPPFLQGSYTLLARLALIERDLRTVDFYLRKKEEHPADIQFNVLWSSSDIVNDLVSAGKIDMAYGHVERFCKDILADPGVVKYLRIIKSGRMLTRETLASNGED